MTAAGGGTGVTAPSPTPSADRGEGTAARGTTRRRLAGTAGIVAAALLAGVLVGLGAASTPLPLLAVAGFTLVVTLIVRHPQAATYAYLAICPLIVGIDRGAALPILRLNEALLGALWFALLAGPVLSWARRGFPAIRVLALDKAVLALAVLSSVTSLLWMYGRGMEITLDDTLYALTLWKTLALYVMVRITIRTGRQMRTAMATAVAATVVVAAVGLVQALGIGGVAEQLVIFSSDEDPLRSVTNNRATSTIGGSLPFADVVLLAAAAAWTLAEASGGRRRTLLRGAAAFLAFSSVASGQVSALVGILTLTIALGWATRQLPRMLGHLVVMALAAYVVLEPVITARFTQVDRATGLPPAWSGQHGRLANLETFFWPRMGEGLNWLLGVQTSARVPTQEPWREWVYIESGYTWLLWNGGVPLLVAFLAFLVIGLRACLMVMRSDASPDLRAAGVTGFVALWLMCVLMNLDPHLTYRGASDLFFPLVAMAATASALMDGRRAAVARGADAAAPAGRG